MQIIKLQEVVEHNEQRRILDDFAARRFPKINDFVKPSARKPKRVYQYKEFYLLLGSQKYIVLFDGMRFIGSYGYLNTYMSDSWDGFLAKIGEVVDEFNLEGIVLGDKILADADTDTVSLESKRLSGTLSLTCLARILDLTSEQLFEQLQKNKVQLIDGEPDQTRKLTTKEHYQTRNNLKPKPPEAGFVLKRPLGRYVWYRHGSCLMTHQGRYYLIGEDEYSCFGSLLVGKPKTIKQAKTSLIPKEVKGKRYRRQGEWLVIKVMPPPNSKVVAFAEQLALPVDDPKSNKYTIRGPYSNLGDANCTMNILVDKSGKVYASKECRLDHNEYGILEWPDWPWATFVRDTAIRSVSIDDSRL